MRLDTGKKWTQIFVTNWRSCYDTAYRGLIWDWAFNEQKLEFHLKRSSVRGRENDFIVGEATAFAILLCFTCFASVLGCNHRVQGMIAFRWEDKDRSSAEQVRLEVYLTMWKQTWQCLSTQYVELEIYVELLFLAAKSGFLSSLDIILFNCHSYFTALRNNVYLHGSKGLDPMFWRK